MQPSNSKSGQNDIILNALKKRYFELAKKENIPHTPDLTKEIDNLENAIKDMLKA